VIKNDLTLANASNADYTSPPAILITIIPQQGRRPLWTPHPPTKVIINPAGPLVLLLQVLRSPSGSPRPLSISISCQSTTGLHHPPPPDRRARVFVFSRQGESAKQPWRQASKKTLVRRGGPTSEGQLQLPPAYTTLRTTPPTLTEYTISDPRRPSRRYHHHTTIHHGHLVVGVPAIVPSRTSAGICPSPQPSPAKQTRRETKPL
jgi:hypothetical protein